MSSQGAVVARKSRPPRTLSGARKITYPVRACRPRGVREQLAVLSGAFPTDRLSCFPKLRFMGSKYRLLPWIHTVLSDLKFDTALDAFSGSGCVGYLMKAMGKAVTTNDFLRFPSTIARAT